MNHLKKEELRAVLQKAKEHSDRDWIMILVAYWHGLRASEVVGGFRTLKGETFYHPGVSGSDISGGYIHVRRQKGSRDNHQPLIANADPLLDEKTYLEKLAAENQGEFFTVCRKTFWEIVQKHAKAAGVAEHKCHPHILKHSIGKHMVKGAGLPNTQQYLGHKNMNSTAVYVRSDDDEAAAAMAAAVGL